MDSIRQLFLIASVIAMVLIPFVTFQACKRLRKDLIAAVISGTGIVLMAALACYGFDHNVTHFKQPTPYPWTYGAALYVLSLGFSGFMGFLNEEERRGALLKAGALALVVITTGGAIAAFMF